MIKKCFFLTGIQRRTNQETTCRKNRESTVNNSLRVNCLENIKSIPSLPLPPPKNPQFDESVRCASNKTGYGNRVNYNYELNYLGNIVKLTVTLQAMEIGKMYMVNEQVFSFKMTY